MEGQRYHEVVRPFKELVVQFGQFVMSKIVPAEAVEFQSQLPFPKVQED